MSDAGGCAGTWLSPRSGQPLWCAREDGHVGACRDATGWWRDDDERNAAAVMKRIHAITDEKTANKGDDRA
jgi:hypothetical protein